MTKDKFDVDTSNFDWYNEVMKRSQDERKPISQMKPSEGCVKIVEFFEGFREEPYYDSAGVLTIGHGETHNVKLGDRISYEESKKHLVKRLEEFGELVKLHVRVPLYQYEFDALTSFTYNLGPGNLANSTLRKKLAQEDYEGAAEEFLKWDKAKVNGEYVSLKGLTRRRSAEKMMFEGMSWGDIEIYCEELERV